MTSEQPIQSSRGPATSWSGWYPYIGALLALLVLLGLYLIASESRRSGQQEAIRRFVAVDRTLGQACERGMRSNDGAAASRRYVESMSAIDLNDVPEEVKLAYQGHTRAWGAMAELLEHYSGISGSFKAGYDGDDAVNAKLTACRKQISDSWGEVRGACAAYGVTVSEDN